jgi:hypothetical protein
VTAGTTTRQTWVFWVLVRLYILPSRATPFRAEHTLELVAAPPVRMDLSCASRLVAESAIGRRPKVSIAAVAPLA